MPHASTFTRTWPMPGSGMSRSTNSKSPPGLLICAAFIFIFMNRFPCLRLFPLTWAQSQSVERVRRQSSGHTQSVAALVACHSLPCFRPSNAVDLSAIVTLARESLLRSGDDRVGGLVGVTVLIGVGIAVSARVVITRVVCVRIAVISVSVVIIGIPVRPPWIESEVKDDPGAIDESAMMPAPNVIAAAIPITLPIG